MPAEIGSAAPDFSLPDQDRNMVSLADLKGRNTLIVFIPFPFTRVCSAEACDLRDNLASLSDADANVVVVTTHANPTNKKWADENDLQFPVLADYWPHGEMAKAYGCFNEMLGVADRTTYVIDADGVVRDILTSESFGVGRNVSDYRTALASL